MSNRTTNRRSAQPPAPIPASSPDRKRVMVIAAVVVGLVVLVGVIIALAGGGDSDDVGNGGGNDVKAVFGAVTIEGNSLPEFNPDVADPAKGTAAPTVRGVSPDRKPVSIGGAGEPTLIAFMAHWCPHCNRELPVLVKLANEGAFDDIRTVAVLTGTDAKAPNFPPAEWIESGGWKGEVLLDDEGFNAGKAFGLRGYPFLVTVNSEGQIVNRISGEVPEAGILDMVEDVKGG